MAAVENIPMANDPEFGRWADTRLDRWLVDWALRNGKDKTAKMIAKEKHIEARAKILHYRKVCLSVLQTLVDIDLFSDIKRIEGALARHSCTEALAWCSENKTALRKMKVASITAPLVVLLANNCRVPWSLTSDFKNTSSFPGLLNAKKPSIIRENISFRGRKPIWIRSSKLLLCSLFDPTRHTDDTRYLLLCTNAVTY